MTYQTPESILRTYWGYPAFRPLQRDIIDVVLNGRDCLALLPTGGGKSICYQVPALLMDGICIVISPLIALMRDQVQQLQQRGILAEAIYSGMHISDIDRILDNCIYGKVKLLYLSPERLASKLAEDRINRMKVSLIAVDESHCISQWGHDFRPAYLEITRIREWHPASPVLALTASATPQVQDEIVAALQMRGPKRIQASFARSNLSYLVYPREDKWERMIEILQKLPGSKLVYTRSRSKTTQLAKIIARHGLRCEAYHAGMQGKAREQVQQRWIDGVTGTVVCTTAFGMGIDKPDVRAVIHYDLPGSLEEYYQEAGRAGRDGKRAFCVLLHDPSDLPKLLERAQKAYPDIAEMTRAYRALCGHFHIPVGGGEGSMFNLDFRAFVTKYQLEPVHTYHCIQGLERAGWIALSDAVFHPSTVLFTASDEWLHEYQAQRPDLEPLIKSLLRNYEGLFLEPVRIREKDLAKVLQCKEKDITEMLERMHREEIIEYTQAGESPRITFTQQRVEDRNLTFDIKLITRLREYAAIRVQSVATYLTENTCRERQLLAYFGEEEKADCGNCDVCRANRNKVSYDSVLLRIPEQGITVKELLGAFSIADRKEVSAVLTLLESDALITMDQDIVRLQA